MSSAPNVSIIICTSSRASDLEQTLRAISQVCVPENLTCELIVVDNASTDNTAQVVHSCHIASMTVRYIHEPQRGKSYAYNTALAAARGDMLLFTDDDVRPPADWIARMCAPLLAGTADGVAGGVKIASHLRLPWLEPVHHGFLASTEYLTSQTLDVMFGANMAFSRAWLAKVPKFDTALGPGALGFYDDSLFTHQLLKAGFRLAHALDVVVEHHFLPSRLSRKSFLSSAKKVGHSQAYVFHHWEHEQNPVAVPRKSVSYPHLRLWKQQCQLLLWRLRHAHLCRVQQGATQEELRLVASIAFYEQYLLERSRTPTYDRHGLVHRSKLLSL